jgi:cytochrome c peroxidase
MRHYHLPIAGLLALLAITYAALTWQRGLDVSVPPPAEERPLPQHSDREPLLPLPPVPELPADRVALGRDLFSDPILSADGSVACASCHVLARGGDDGARVSLGVAGAAGSMNAPTVFNAALNFAQFWDGRVDSLEAQVDGPLQNPVEMATTWPAALERLRAHPEYPARFAAAYPDGLNADNVRDALVSFERTLLTPARLDRFLAGDSEALDADEMEGYRRFKQFGCASCHQGANVGGNLFQRFGVMEDYFALAGTAGLPANQGRFKLTGLESDRHVFKVPSLRNVAVTAPYFHDGSVDSLTEAVSIMGRVQLGQSLSDEDVRLIVAFLDTLTGTYEGEPLQ